MREGVITAVERQAKQKQRYNIFIDGEFAFGVHEDVLIKHRLMKGATVHPGQLEEVLREDELQSAYLRVLRWLGSRQRTEKEIKRYLNRHKYEAAIVDEVIAKVRAQGYVDDERFSQTVAEERLVSHGKGKNWIRQELLQKGVDRSIVQTTLTQIDEEAELASATDIARKRWRTMGHKGDPREAKRKLTAFLARRGYTAGIVKSAVSSVTADTGDEWDDAVEDWSWE
ncbi:RecX family transcriptional regulator [Paenibacillus thermotolerans]|uniref:RecX family transcriptional regulator n=1 Tax=Paenibacillus thermotolerans TaxID=3027807 RepID=UPI002367EB1C|nr:MULTISPECIES: RecX family transcriptional regulator [unclassified Paenibacillus]